MRLFTACLLCFVLAACAGDSASGWSELDLTPHNIPLKIQAPDSAVVEVSSLSGVMDDVTIKAPDENYSIQVLASKASTNDMSRLKAEQLDLVRDNRYFERIVEEEPQGFIFENRIDTLSVYGFRYIIYQGDREFVFQNAFDGIFTLEQVKDMYTSVKPAAR